MWLKTTIMLLFCAILASLSSGFYFFIKDRGDTQSRRLLNSLAIRVSLAVLLLLCVIHGLWSGELALRAPWQ